VAVRVHDVFLRENAVGDDEVVSDLIELTHDSQCSRYSE
jgi:hypothetical protein